MSAPKTLIVDDSRESQKNLELMLVDIDVQLYTAGQTKHQWVMQVKDKGIGISADHLEDLFLLFKSFPPPGK